MKTFDYKIYATINRALEYLLLKWLTGVSKRTLHGHTGIFNVLGLPFTAVPLGMRPKEELPVGLQIVANRNQDRLCLAVASELERVFGGSIPLEIIS